MSVSDAIDALKAVSADLIALPGTEEYNETLKTYLSTLESDIQPAAFALPKTRDDVVATLQTLKPFDNEIPVAIAGAGQQPAPGVANIGGGITIHLRCFKGIEVNSEKNVVSISPGETWGPVYEKLDPLGLSVSGCRASSGGIGGLATHGGISFFSSERGFIADDVLNYEVVLADGEVINANADEHADLFIALKGGGGSNFGVITRFDLATFKQGKMWGGKFLFFPQSFPGQLEALAEYLNGPNTDPKAQVRINIGYAAEFGGMMCMNDPTYTKPEKPEAISAFVDVEPRVDAVNTLRVDTVKSMADEQAGQTIFNQRLVYMTTTLKANADILKTSLDKFYISFEKIKDIPGLVYAATYEPYPVSLLEVGRNSLGLDAKAGPLVLLLLYASWKDPEDDDLVLGETKNNLDAIIQAAKETGQGSPYTYMNYAFSGQDPISSYGEEQKKKLIEVSKKYDPDGFFQKAVRGGFKLS